jgi:hypothetical protein
MEISCWKLGMRNRVCSTIGIMPFASLIPFVWNEEDSFQLRIKNYQAVVIYCGRICRRVVINDSHLCLLLRDVQVSCHSQLDVVVFLTIKSVCHILISLPVDY